MSSAALHDGALAVPVIDITSFRMPYADETVRAGIVAQVDEAARTVGFMQITGHGIPAATLGALAAATDAFFALDAKLKHKYRCPPGINRGYTPPKTENSLGPATAAGLFEAMNIGAGVCAPNVYPAEVPEFEAAVTDWFMAAGTVARTMVRIFGVALGGREDYFAPFADHSIDVLRINNYCLPDAEPGEAGQPGMGAHTDYGIVTVLWADPVPGLEILGADDGWHPVRPVDGALLVNLGDAIARWTNDQWISTTHRVAAPRADGANAVCVPRRSAAYFHGGRLDSRAAREAARLLTA